MGEEVAHTKFTDCGCEARDKGADKMVRESHLSKFVRGEPPFYLNRGTGLYTPFLTRNHD
jgi:hypothetical protein